MHTIDMYINAKSGSPTIRGPRSSLIIHENQFSFLTFPTTNPHSPTQQTALTIRAA